jgi:hypothetical protein
MSSDSKLLNMSSKDESKTEETKEKPMMMKGGLRDRHILSWIRILLVTAIWWVFVAGFFCLCFLLMNQILYGSKDTQPYFVRNFMKYPGILDQPGLNIKCRNLMRGEEDSSCDTTSLSIGINKIYNWKPETFTNEDNPETSIYVGTANMKEDLKKMGVTELPTEDLVYVTCNGRKQEDKDNLEGIKMIGVPGFNVDGFPWMGKNETWLKPLSLDLSNSAAAKSNAKRRVFMECRAWAKNIKMGERFVDKKVPHQGGLAVLCFEDGKIISIGEENC